MCFEKLLVNKLKAAFGVCIWGCNIATNQRSMVDCWLMISHNELLKSKKYMINASFPSRKSENTSFVKQKDYWSIFFHSKNIFESNRFTWKFRIENTNDEICHVEKKQKVGG